MEIKIVIVGIKRYFEIIDGKEVFVRDEHLEINTDKNNPELVLEQYEAIKTINQ